MARPLPKIDLEDGWREDFAVKDRRNEISRTRRRKAATKYKRCSNPECELPLFPHDRAHRSKTITRCDICLARENGEIE